jgi:hypothetical protein
MKRCKDCQDWKPLDGFYLRKRGAGLGRVSYCRECMAARWRARNDKRKAKYEGSAFAHRLPDETALDYARHAFGFWPNLQLVKLAVSQAPARLIPATKRELVAMARAA